MQFVNEIGWGDKLSNVYTIREVTSNHRKNILIISGLVFRSYVLKQPVIKFRMCDKAISINLASCQPSEELIKHSREIRIDIKYMKRFSVLRASNTIYIVYESFK